MVLHHSTQLPTAAISTLSQSKGWQSKSCLLPDVTMTSMTTSFPKQAERLLQRSAVGICEIDSAGRCLYLNPAGAQLLGYEARQLVGAVLHNVIHPSGQSNSPVPCSICQTMEAAPTLLVGEPQRFSRDLFLHKE